MQRVPRRGLGLVLALAVVATLLALVLYAPFGPEDSTPSRAGVERIDPTGESPSGLTAAGRSVGAYAEQTTVTVRDLAGGSPVAGLPLEHTGTDGSGEPRRETVTTTDQGRVELSRWTETELNVLGRDWRVVDGQESNIDSGHTIWAYRLLTLCGSVGSTGERALDFSTVTLDVVPAGLTQFGLPASTTPDPWSPAWLARHGFRRSPIPLDDTGRFEAIIPRIDGWVARATAPEWRMAWVRIPTEQERADIQLVLRPSYTISGVLRSSDGQALGHVQVVAYITATFRYDELSMETLSLEGHDAYTAQWLAKDDLAASTHIQPAVTQSDGTFRLDLKKDGEVLLIIHAAGHVPLERQLGWLASDREGLDLEAQRVPSPTRVRIQYDGMRLSNHSLTIGDLSVSPLVQPAVTIETDAAGEVKTDWLVVGRSYLFVVRGHGVPDQVAKGYLVWRGQSGIDLRHLPHRLNEFQGDR